MDQNRKWFELDKIGMFDFNPPLLLSTAALWAMLHAKQRRSCWKYPNAGIL